VPSVWLPFRFAYPICNYWQFSGDQSRFILQGMSNNTALILGASGKIGSHSARAFASAGWEVRRYDRRAGNLREAARGADVIVNGWNPPAYHDWAGQLPRMTEQIIDAAKASGATVIVPGNVYNFGDRPGTWSEFTPQEPVSRKGKVRKEMEQTYQRSGVPTIVLRAGNFIDPERNGDVMSLLFLRSIARGKLTVAGDPAAMQSYCYLPDWAKAAVQLAEMRSSLATFEDVPFPGHNFTALELRDFLARELGREIEFTKFPWALFTLLSPFWELAREMREMRYLWSVSHTLSAHKFSCLLPEFRPTSLAEVMRAGLPPSVQAPSVLQHA
jgi:nucleoside-diphosphate-sugar epimerase